MAVFLFLNQSFASYSPLEDDLLKSAPPANFENRPEVTLQIRCSTTDEVETLDRDAEIKENESGLADGLDAFGKVAYLEKVLPIYKSKNYHYNLIVRFTKVKENFSTIYIAKYDSNGKLVSAAQTTFDGQVLIFEDYTEKSFYIKCVFRSF